MAWDVVSPGFGGRLTAAMVRQIGDNFYALASGSSGAPPMAVNSLMVTGVASIQQATFGQAAITGLAVSGVSSFSAMHADTARFTGVVSAQGVYSNFGAVSGVFSAGAVSLSNSAPAAPAPNHLYKDSICKGWVNFSGSGTIAIRASFNVLSVTDNGIGDYTVNWATPFADANYVVVATGKYDSVLNNVYSPRLGIKNTVDNPSSGSVRMVSGNVGGVSWYDLETYNIIAVGNQ
ncbi:MAG: hypothetical protein OEW12_08170 [Deltaproteobacteria bacterium]|nr:hypothetical protein [Deltaproteobacteria bacterium]